MSLLVLLLAAAAGCAGRAVSPCTPLGPATETGAYLLPGTQTGIPYATRDGRPLAFDVFTHDDTAARPTAIVLRGGSGVVGHRTSFVGQFVETLAAAGYQVVLPDYRSTSVDTARDDVVALLRTLECHGPSLRVDSNRIVAVAEHDAGDIALDVVAHLAGLRRGRFAGQPPPPIATVVLGGTYASTPASIADPTLLVHGTADREVPPDQARSLCARATPGVDCVVADVDGGIHRPENWTPAQWGYKARMVDWLASHAGRAPAPAWPRDNRLHKGIVFDRDRSLTLDAFVPDGPGPFAAAILVHGGGWEAGDRVTYITPMFSPLAERGVAWFSIDYRLTPDVSLPEQLDDVARAVTFVRSHAPDYRVDPARIVLVGESASGQIVTQLATDGIDVAGVVSFYGVYDLEPMAGDPSSPRSLARRLFGLTTLNESGRAQLRRYSPLHRVHARMPPLLLVTGTGDALWAQAQAFEQALIRAGARYDTVVLREAPHGMQQWDGGDPRWRSWSADVAGWIVRTTTR